MPAIQAIFPRTVRPEVLDSLSPDCPAARASRRDLRILNLLLGTRAWFESVLRERRRVGERVLELGAGNGELGRALGSVAPELAGLDLCRRPRDWPVAAPWFQGDLLEFAGWAGFPVVIANLILHHFDPAQLERLGVHLNRHARLVVASEPLRTRRTERWFALVCRLIRAHSVTRYDGRVSVAAGFRHAELPQLLRLDPGVWRWRVDETWRGAVRMVAERRP